MNGFSLKFGTGAGVKKLEWWGYRALPGFDLPRRLWCTLNRFRTGQGWCAASLTCWQQITDPTCCDCGAPQQTMMHIVEDCPLSSDKIPERSSSSTPCWWECTHLARHAKQTIMKEENKKVFRWRLKVVDDRISLSSVRSRFHAWGAAMEIHGPQWNFSPPPVL